MNVSARTLAPLCAAALLVAMLPATAQDATQNELRAVRGEVGYQTDRAAAFKRLFGQIALPGNDYAITHAASNALVVLPDSSEVALGANTSVQFSAFQSATLPTPTTIAIGNGAMRFDIRHPAGGQSNYRFSSTTSQIAVRGTVALFSTSPAGGDTIVCLQCAADDVLVTVNATGRTISLLTGQTLTVSPLGAAAVAATTSASLTGFAAAGLSTLPTSTAFAPGIGAAAAGNVPIAGIAAVAAVAAAVGITAADNGGATPGNQSNNPAVGHPAPTPSPTATPTSPPTTTPTTTPTVSPTATATASTAPITVITNATKRATPPAAPTEAPAHPGRPH